MKKLLLCIITLLVSCNASNYSTKGHYKVGKPYIVKGRKYTPKQVNQYEQTGIASWYGIQFQGRKTANGEIYNRHGLTAAHRTLPLPCLVRVTNLENGKQVIVKINDRGPFSQPSRRIIDLSEKAAEILGMKKAGTAKVKIQYLSQNTKNLHKKT